MSEVFKPISLYCDVGKTQATILVNGGELFDNAEGYVTTSCAGCIHWFLQKIRKVEREIKVEYGEESQADRVNQLEQHLVDQARFLGGESKIVVATCTPLGCS
jgi:hypothetical protein